MHRAHLQRFMPELGELDAYVDIMYLVERGIAYHHGGMLPILREFVELCFQQRLIMLVFATETLAVGVNMPARSVVFSQLDKPNDGDLPGHRPLRPDEFWQMAGRAGRRGMDELGYVLYAPTLSVAGLRNMATSVEVREMLTGQMPAARSQLVVDRPFVLRQLLRNCGAEDLSRTLAADQLQRQNQSLAEQLDKDATAAAECNAGGGGEGGASGGGDASGALLAAAQRAAEIARRLEGGDQLGGMKVTLNPKQRKGLEAELQALRATHGASLDAVHAQEKARQKLTAEMAANAAALRSAWDGAFAWLADYGFVEGGGASEGAEGVGGGGAYASLTARGAACAAFADGHPLILGTIIADGWLKQLTQAEVCAWLCLFLKDGRVKGLEEIESQPLPKPSAKLLEVFAATDELAEILEVELDRTLALIMLDWVATKDIARIANWIEAPLLGTFVKAVMRIISYVDVVKDVLLGLGEYEGHNALDNHTDLLLGGLVTNESLYLRLAE